MGGICPPETPMTPVNTSRTRGRRLTKRDVIAIGDAEISTIDWDERLTKKTRERLKADAVKVLEAAGIPAGEILRASPGGSHLRGVVMHDHSAEPDSPIGLAARIVELCIRVEELPAMGASASMIAGDAYRLGRLAVLAKVYGLDAEQRRKAAKAARPNARKIDREEILDEFQKLIRGGRHTEGQARGILERRGLASQSTIHRITKSTVQPAKKKPIL